MFDLKDKVVLITGGCGGIGAAYAEEFIKNGVKGVALLDINEETGRSMESEYSKKYGPNKLIFIKTDAAQLESLKSAFQKVIGTFKQLDIVINNAGIMNEVDPAKTVNINLTAVIYGCDLARQLLPKHRAGQEAIIVNTASVAGLMPLRVMSIYGATKAAVIHYGRSIGDTHNYNESKIKVITICPAGTDTEIINEKRLEKTIKPETFPMLMSAIRVFPLQQPSVLASVVVKIIEKAVTGSVWIVDQGNDEEVKFPMLFKMPGSKKE